MSDSEPSHWQVAQALMANIRELQRRAETDSIRFGLLAAGFLVVRGSAASSLSILGLQIDDLTLVQFAIVPLAAFLALRFLKAQVLTASCGSILGHHMARHLETVPTLVCPADWDLVRDMTHRSPRRLHSLSFVVSMAMFAAVVAALAVNAVDATAGNWVAALISMLATDVLIFTAALAFPSWPTSVIGAPSTR